MALPDMLSMFESLRLDMQDLYWRGVVRFAADLQGPLRCCKQDFKF